ncbi:hypothetical protein PROFUN_05479 [Planoprotostelium fungivorum]|uniref:Mechanosensitive ion channel MscS domain-containing protein n=1 Tax=Planoprotostelium fungivorum TaxID=1890364 RepID=A0A2P6NR28_9EUKA|nr:hypothetical protein PROFUN_05479 [Planoprotostelium fungivorum]
MLRGSGYGLVSTDSGEEQSSLRRSGIRLNIPVEDEDPTPNISVQRQRFALLKDKLTARLWEPWLAFENYPKKDIPVGLIIFGTVWLLLNAACDNLPSVLHSHKFHRWILLADGIVSTCLIFYVLFRWMIQIMGRMARRFTFMQYTYFLIYPFERLIWLVTSSIFTLFIYSAALQDYSIEAQDGAHLIWYLLVTVLEISLLYAARRVTIAALYTYIYKDLREQIVISHQHEMWVREIENHVHDGQSELSQRFDTQELCLDMDKGREFGYSDEEVELPINEASEVLSHKLLQKFGNGNNYLTLEDFGKILSSNPGRTFKFFDLKGDGKIGDVELVESLSQIFKNRRIVVNRMRSRRLSVDVLSTLMSIFLTFVCILLLLYNLSVDVLHLAVATSTLLLGLSFAYSTPLQELFYSLHMLYSVQPFDIGDHIRINGGPVLVVDDVGVLTSKFHSVDGYDVYLRNDKLTHSQISNLNRGKTLVVEVQFAVNMSVSMQQVSDLNKKIEEYLNQSLMWSHYNLSVSNESKLSTVMEMTLRVNIDRVRWQQATIWTAARTALMVELQKMLIDLHMHVETAQLL